MKLSIIIPTLNEEKNIEKLLLHLNSIENISAHNWHKCMQVNLDLHDALSIRGAFKVAHAAS